MGKYSEAAKKARKMTNKELATEMAALAPINREVLQNLLPRKRDKETFLALMAVVEAETNMDNKLDYLKDNLKSAGTVLLKILKIFV